MTVQGPTCAQEGEGERLEDGAPCPMARRPHGGYERNAGGAALLIACDKGQQDG